MELTITTEAQDGFDFIAGLEKTTANALIAKTVEDRGLSYLQDKKRIALTDLLSKVEKNPTAYKASIEAIAIIEAEKEVIPPIVEPIEVIKGV